VLCSTAAPQAFSSLVAAKPAAAVVGVLRAWSFVYAKLSTDTHVGGVRVAVALLRGGRAQRARLNRGRKWECMWGLQLRRSPTGTYGGRVGHLLASRACGHGVGVAHGLQALWQHCLRSLHYRREGRVHRRTVCGGVLVDLIPQKEGAHGLQVRSTHCRRLQVCL